MSPSPAVSVIIPAYNLEGYIDACLQSVLAQTYANFEAVVVDDGSTDGTPGLLSRYAQRDPRIVVVSTPNQGVARARETGVARARGKYICFLDGDDFWEPRMLEEMTFAIEQNGGYDIVCCNHKRVCKTYQSPVRAPRKGDMEGLDFLKALLSNEIWGGVWGKLYRRELFECGICHHPLRLWQDVVVNMQIACRRPRVRFIDYVGYDYVQRSGSSNHSGLDFAYCRLFCDTVKQEIMRHAGELDGAPEFCVLLNNFRTYMMYLCKSRSPWVGNQPFVCNLRESVARYRDELGAYYSRARMLLLELDRYRAMRPVVLMLTTGLRWRTSLRRRLAR